MWWLSACQQEKLDEKGGCSKTADAGGNGVVGWTEANNERRHSSSMHHLASLLRVLTVVFFALAAYTYLKHVKLFTEEKPFTPLVSMQTERLEMAGVAPVAPVGEGESLFAFNTCYAGSTLPVLGEFCSCKVRVKGRRFDGA